MDKFGFYVYQDCDPQDPEYVAAYEAWQQADKDANPAYRDEMGRWLGMPETGLEPFTVPQPVRVVPLPPKPEPPKIDQWGVQLPHQCDSWQITGSKDEEGYWQDVAGHEQATADLERFIAEANEALAALRERREYGEWS